MSPNTSERLLNRNEAAAYIRERTGSKTTPATIAVWDCLKRHDLKPIRKKEGVFYSASVLEEFCTRDQRP